MEEVNRLKEDELSDAAAETSEEAVKINVEIVDLAEPLIEKIKGDIEAAAEQIHQKDPPRYSPDQAKLVIKTTLSKLLSDSQGGILKKDPNYAVKVEQAIIKKYGENTVQHPKKDWTDEKEKKYLSQLKSLHNTNSAVNDEVEIDGILISKKLLTRESERSCPVCNTYSFKSKDDVYMSKFGCCEKCYIQWVEGREDRWKKGWRPNAINKKAT